MKQCNNCGIQLPDDSSFCTNCGATLAQPAPQQTYADPQQPYANPQQPYGVPQQGYYPQRQPSGLATAAKILMIIGTVFMGLYIIPLAWCIPMTVSYSKKIKNGIPVSTGFKICSLLFVSMIGGILMLCDKDN